MLAHLTQKGMAAQEAVLDAWIGQYPNFNFVEIDVATQSNSDADFRSRGKTISQLIDELLTFEDQGLFVEISVDDGDTQRPISLVMKVDGKCVLVNCEKPSMSN